VPGVHTAAIAFRLGKVPWRGYESQNRRGAGEIIQFLFFFSISLSLFFDDFGNSDHGATNYRREI
jgi:hypothetical protein